MSQLINKYLSKADLDLLNKLEKAVKNTSMSITCTGLYNHGKSSILNCLIKDFDEKTFPTADIRETTRNKSVTVGNITYIDTPGLNANTHDNKKVMNVVKESDINLFVHTITTGEFVEKEMKFLIDIKRHWENPKEFIQRSIFIISRIDQVNNEKDITKATSKISTQILSLFGIKPTILTVSAKRYIKGNRDNKNLMIKKSYIHILEAEIKNLTTKLNTEIQFTRKKRIKECYSDLIQKFRYKIESNKTEIIHLKEVNKQTSELLLKDISNIENTLEIKYSNLAGV